jgi:hypothetical protein
MAYRAVGRDLNPRGGNSDVLPGHQVGMQHAVFALVGVVIACRTARLHYTFVAVLLGCCFAPVGQRRTSLPPRVRRCRRASCTPILSIKSTSAHNAPSLSRWSLRFVVLEGWHGWYHVCVVRWCCWGRFTCPHY